jgi:hypothetical protein
MGGTQQPPRGQIPPHPFQGGLDLVPNPVGNLGSAPSHRCCRCHCRHHHCHRQRDSRLDVILARWLTHHARPCQHRRCSQGSGSRTLQLGGWGASAGVVVPSPPTPILVARAGNNHNKDGRIIVKEMREKMRRGWRALIITPWTCGGGRSTCL